MTITDHLLTPDDIRAEEDIDLKAVHVITADVKASVDNDGSFEAILSIPTLDRDDEIVDAKAFEPLPDFISIDVDHGMSTITTVGSGQPYYDGDTLKIRNGKFASTQLGQDVRALVAEGHVRHMSVAMLRTQRERDQKDGKMHVRSAELLNAAFTPVPSNRDAAVLAAKAAATKVGARNSSKDAEMIQSVHDSAAALGAACSGSTKSAQVVDEMTTQTTAVCETCGQAPAATDPEDTAAQAAVVPPADVLLAQAQASIASASLALLP